MGECPPASPPRSPTPYAARFWTHRNVADLGDLHVPARAAQQPVPCVGACQSVAGVGARDPKCYSVCLQLEGRVSLWLCFLLRLNLHVIKARMLIVSLAGLWQTGTRRASCT